MKYAAGTAKTVDRWRMNSELAKSYIATKDLTKALTFASRSYEASKALIKDPTSKVNPADAVLQCDPVMIGRDDIRTHDDG